MWSNLGILFLVFSIFMFLVWLEIWGSDCIKKHVKDHLFLRAKTFEVAYEKCGIQIADDHVLDHLLNLAVLPYEFGRVDSLLKDRERVQRNFVWNRKDEFLRKWDESCRKVLFVAKSADDIEALWEFSEAHLKSKMKTRVKELASADSDL